MPTLTAHDIRSARFAATKFREGYDITEVDALLERIAATFEHPAGGRVGSLTADDVLNARFQATKFREGYDQDEVDDFLDTVVLALRAGSTPAGVRPVSKLFEGVVVPRSSTARPCGRVRARI